jgi:hypothetical protein
VRVVGFDRQHPRLAARFPRLLGEHQRVGVEDLAWPGLRADRPYLVAGRADEDQRLPPDDRLGLPCRCHRRQVGGAQPVAFRQQQLAGRHVLADRADMLVRGDGRAQFGAAFPAVLARPERFRPGRASFLPGPESVATLIPLSS